MDTLIITNVRNGSFSGDLTADTVTATTTLTVGTTNVYDNLPTGDIVWSDTDNKFKLGVDLNVGGSATQNIQPLLLANLLSVGYVPFVDAGGAGSSTVNSKVSDSWLKINSNTLELDWTISGSPGYYQERNIKMRKQGSFVNQYKEATYDATSITFTDYVSASDIDTAKISGTNAGRIRINDTYDLPAGDGTSGQVLTTDGSGGLSWAAAGSSLDLQDVTTNGNTTTNNILIGSGSAYAGTGVTSLTINNDSYPLLSLGSSSANRMALIGYSNHNLFSSSNPFVFDTTSNVGIGTGAAPSTKLHVKGTGTVLRLEGTSSYTDIIITTSANTGYLNLDNDKMNFYVGGGAGQDLKMSILNNGSVGIGNSAPSNYGGYSTLHIGSATSIGLIKLGTGASADGPEIFTNSDKDIVFNSAGTGTRMTIDGTNGRVGIGETSPDATLHVKSSATTGTIRLGGGNGTGESRLYFDSNGHNSYIDSYGDSGYKDLKIQARDLYLNTNSSTGTGNVITGGYFEINKSSDKKLRFVDGRTGANIYSIEHDTSQIYFYNETTAAIPFLIQNSGNVNFQAGSIYVTSGDVNSNRLYLNTSSNCIFTKPDGSNLVRYLYSGANVNVVFTGGTSANSGAWGINNYENSVRIVNVLNDGTAYISNKLGIGGNAGGYRLDVHGGSAFRDTLRVIGGSNDVVHLSWLSGDNGIVSLYNGGTLSTRLQATGLSYFANSNLAVGSTATYHSAKLSVAGKIHFQRSQDSDIGGAIFSTWTQGANSTDYYAGDLRFQVFNASSGTYGLVDAMMLDGKGFLGIGTTSPAETLDVNGSFKWNGVARLTDSAYFVGSANYGFRFNDSTDYYNNVIFYNNGNSYFRGDVGVGTNGPDAKLEVSGGSQMTGAWNKTAMLSATYPVLLFNSNNSKWAGLAYDWTTAFRLYINSSNADVTAERQYSMY